MTLNRITLFLHTIAMTLMISASQCNSEPLSDMNKYWVKFRQAIIRGDTREVASLTRFPLRVGGILDSHPVIMHDRKNFPRILTQLLDQRITLLEGGAITEKRLVQHIKDKTEITAKDFNTPSMVTVEVLEFEMVHGKWLLTGAYLEE